MFDDGGKPDHWSQVTGTAVKGPSEGTKLEFVSSTLTTWAAWKALHPSTQVLKKTEPIRESHYARYYENPDRMGISGDFYEDDRLPGKAMVLGVVVGGKTFAISFERLAELKILNATLNGVPVVITFSPQARSSQAYRRDPGGEILEFSDYRIEKGVPVMKDLRYGKTYNLLDGSSDESADRLEAIHSTRSFWYAWSSYHPETELLEGK